jgi:hypothetical protein
MNSVAVKEDHAGMDQPRKTALPECDHHCLRSAFLALAESRANRKVTWRKQTCEYKSRWVRCSPSD